MAIVVEFNAPGMTATQYDSILSDLDSKGVGFTRWSRVSRCRPKL